MPLRNNRDVVASAGIADGTPLDTFFSMNGREAYITLDDLFEETPSNLETLHAMDNDVSLTELFEAYID